MREEINFMSQEKVEGCKATKSGINNPTMSEQEKNTV
jgi:hypothetical protein